jgi:two-component system response regulator FixJ
LVDVPVRRVRVIAIVDDDESVRLSIKFLLETADYVVRSYEQPARFLDAEWRDLDCLVVDQHMPVHTGLEVLARLRGRGTLLPVVLITGSTSVELERQAVELGAIVLVKPLLDADLLGVLARVMG